MPGLLPRHFFWLLKYVKNKHLALFISIFDKLLGFKQPFSDFF